MRWTLAILLTLTLTPDVDGLIFGRRRRRGGCGPVNCVWGGWSAWGPCSHPCGNAGTQTRSRGVASGASCGGAGCSGPSSQTQACNRFCHNGGTAKSGYCDCPDAFWGNCCPNREYNTFHCPQTRKAGKLGG